MLPKKQNRDRNRKEIERKMNKETIKTGRKKECIVSKQKTEINKEIHAQRKHNIANRRKKDTQKSL